jgi:hypothetical protein
LAEEQIGKFQRDPHGFDLRQLAKATESFTGSEIDQVFIEALYRAFEQEEEPTDLTIGAALVDCGRDPRSHARRGVLASMPFQ